MNKEVLNLLRNPISGGRRFTIFSESSFSISQLPADHLCEECNSPQRLVYRSNIHQGEEVYVFTPQVPAYQCVDGCRGTWYPSEVALDLSTKAEKILRIVGETRTADALLRNIREWDR